MWWYVIGRSIQYLRSRSRSNVNGTGVLRAATRSSARSEIATGDMPGGAASAFCVHE